MPYLLIILFLESFLIHLFLRAISSKQAILVLEIFWINLMNLVDKELGSSKNTNIPLLIYQWDITGKENETMGSLLWSLYDAHENNDDLNSIRKKMVDIDDYAWRQLIPKFFKLDPSIQSAYNCNISKYVPEK